MTTKRRATSIVLRIPPLNTPVVVRVTPAARAAFLKAAERAGYTSMSSWARELLYRAANLETIEVAAARAELTLPEWIRTVLYVATNQSALGAQLSRVMQ